MNKPLKDALILVADDQIDVAKTHCLPLHQAGARVRYVADGHAALAALSTYAVDLLVLDMKMPPDDWGGLWLLQELRAGGWHVPVLVLSGEGTARQIKEALRLGANDWMDKDSASEELLDRCVVVLTDHLSAALNEAAVRLPTPLAHRFDRYARSSDSEKRLNEGLHTLEALLRFTAAVGLSNKPPTRLRGISPAHISAPSMGIWLNLCISLADAPGAATYFTRLLSYLMPDRADRQIVQNFVSVRNDIAHGRATPDRSQGEALDTTLRRFAHRMLSAWRTDLAMPINMTYDGSEYCVEILKLRGVTRPVPDQVRIENALISGVLVLLSPGCEPLPLAPWLLAHATDNTDTIHYLQFDGVQRTKGSPAAQTPLRYIKVDGGNDLVPTGMQHGGTWQSVLPWMSE